MINKGNSMFNEIFEYSQQSYIALWSALLIIAGTITAFSLFTGFGGDVDFDIDIDVDADLDGHVDAHGLLHSFYLFMNLGKVPVTLIFFILVAVNWGLCLIINMTFNSSNSTLIGWLIFPVALLISFPILKVIALPLKKFFGALLEDEEKQTRSIGSICTATTEVTDKAGQASFKDGPTVINLMVMCEEGKTIQKGKKAVVIKKNDIKNRYIISEIEDDIFN